MFGYLDIEVPTGHLEMSRSTAWELPGVPGDTCRGFSPLLSSLRLGHHVSPGVCRVAVAALELLRRAVFQKACAASCGSRVLAC